MSEGKLLNGQALDMELKTERIEEIPSTDTNMSADQLLAAIPSGLEVIFFRWNSNTFFIFQSDDEDDLLND